VHLLNAEAGAMLLFRKKCMYNLSHMDLTKYHEHLIDDEKVNLEFLTRKHDLKSLQVVHENLCSRMNLLSQSKLMKSKKASTLLVLKRFI
jgi:hypothetical protein